MPNIKIPTKHLNKPKNFDPLKPKDDLNKTTKGKPYFCDGLPIKFEKKYTSNDPNNVPKKTINEFKSYIKYRDAISENPIML